MGRQSRETTELQWRFPLFFCWQWLPPRQTPRLRPTPTFCTEDTMAMASATVMDTDTPTATDTTDTTARGRPRLSPRLMLTLTSCTVDTTAMVLATDTDMDTPTATATTARGRLRPTLRSLSEPTPTLPTPMLPLLLSLPPS